MALHGQESNTNVSATFSGSASQPQKEAAAQQSPGQKDSYGFSWSALHSFSGHSMTRSPIGEVLQQTLVALEEQFKGHKVSSYEVKLIPLDMKDFTRLPTSVILVTLRDKSVSTPVVSVHTLILEGSVEPWGPVTEMINGVSVEVQRPTSEAYKTGIDQIVADEVTRIYPGSTLLSADANVVPRHFDLEDKARVYSLAANSLLAAESRLFEYQGRAELNVAKASNDSSLSVRTAFLTNQAQQLDAVGQPLRSDIEVSIISKFNQTQNTYGQNLLERQRDVGYVTGFIDAIWDPVQQQGGFGQFQQFNQFNQTLAQDGSLPTAKVRPLFVITDSRIQDLSSLTAQIFSIFPAMLLREANLWQAAFRPRAVVQGINPKNVGALNLEANLPIVNGQADPSGRGAIIDVASANFNEQDFFHFMQAVFRPGLGIAIDSPECGSSTWYNNIFVAAAMGNQQAYEELYNATNELTNGNFGKRFNKGEAIATHYSVVHNGWYSDAQGHKRDIRDFDLIALLNHPMAEDKIVVDAWINSFQNTGASIKARLHDRYRIISKAYSDITLTGFSNRIILTDKFLTSALQGAYEAGLQLQPQNQFADQGIVSRVSANLNSGLFGMGAGAPVFQSNIGMPGNMNMGGGFAGRYGWNR